MKKLLLTLFALLAMTVASNAQSLSSLTWAQVCQGKMGDAWYGTDEAKKVADILLSVQKSNGGWMKNDQFHKLTAAELAARKAYDSNDGIYAHSCFDNYATTQEMRFLVRVYKATKEQKYLDSFKKAVNLIITAGNGKKGGWGQYWPNSGNGSYQDYITFNDDLMTNIMKMLQDVYENKGDFEGLVDEATRTKCKTAFDKALQCVLNCQIDDNGVKAAWCAQHDPTDFLPTEGRPHEEPSVSAYESATLLSYLMSLPEPSDDLKACIKSAVLWLKDHKYKTNAYIEDVKDSKGNVVDRRISSKSGSNVWGRFIQIGGESGKKVYDKFYKKLKDRNKKRAHHVTGYEYYEWEILEESYDPTKEYQPIFSVYTDKYPELFYRHLYSYEDTPNKTDKHGQEVITSLPAENRKSYQYLGSWPDKIINVEYPAWCRMNNVDSGITGGGEEGPVADDYSPIPTDAADTPIAVGNDVTITFLNNTSKGSVANQGTWTFNTGTCAADQNACEVQMVLTAPKTVTIHFGKELANNKSINMKDAEGKGIAGKRVDGGETIASGSCASTNIVAGDADGVIYELPVGTYVFYAAGTKWTFGSVSFLGSSTGVEEVKAVAQPVAAAKKYFQNGQLVIETANGIVTAAGAQIK